MKYRYFLIPVCVIPSILYQLYRNMSSVEEPVVSTEPTSKPPGAAPVPSLPRLYIDINPTQLPIIYSPAYDISFFGFEKLHPFDTQKWGHIFKFLLEAGVLANKAQSVEPLQVIDTELLTHHTRRYIDSLSVSLNVAGIAEIPPVAAIPNFIVQKVLLTPIRYQVSSINRDTCIVVIVISAINTVELGYNWHSRRQVSKTVGVLRENLLVVGAPIGRMYRNLLDKS